jgi:hypothetical protein
VFVMFALVTLVIAAWSCPPADSVCPHALQGHNDGLDVRSVLLVCAFCVAPILLERVTMMIAAVRGENVRDRVGARPPNRGLWFEKAGYCDTVEEDPTQLPRELSRLFSRPRARVWSALPASLLCWEMALVRHLAWQACLREAYPLERGQLGGFPALACVEMLSGFGAAVAC